MAVSFREKITKVKVRRPGSGSGPSSEKTGRMTMERIEV